MAERLYQRASISQQEFQLARGKVELTLATLQGMDDDFADELARLELVIKKKTAELDQALAQKEVALSVVARNERINHRKPGMISSEDVANAEAQLHVAEAHMRVKAVEQEEPKLQHQHVERWRGRIRQILQAMQKDTDAAAAAPNSSGRN
jgi:hypothetical protein